MHICRIIIIMSLRLYISIADRNLIIPLSVNYNNNRLLHFDTALIQIFQECYKKYEVLVVSAVNNDNINIKFLSNVQLTTSLIIYDADFSPNSTKTVHKKKIDGFVVFIQPSRNYSSLINTVKIFRKTSWKKSMPYIFIVHKSENSCDESETILKLIWQFRVISYYFCADYNGNLFIFTYNPFSARAPDQWKLKKIYKIDKNNWALFARKYNKDNICDQQDFDRMKFFDHYRISIASSMSDKHSKFYGKTYPPQKFEAVTKKLTVLIKEYTRTVISVLSVSSDFYVMPNIHHLSSESKNNLLSSLIHESIDIVFQPFSRSTSKVNGYDYTFPAYCYQSGILVRSRGFKTPLEKIRDFYGIWTLLFTIFVLIVTFVIIWLIENRRIYFAAFEIIRLLITAGLNTRMDTVPLRMFFSMVFIYFLVIHATFSGHLAEFLTKPELRKHPETLEDLQPLGYKRIFGPKSMKYSLLILDDNDELQFRSDGLCWKRLINDTEAACINDHLILSIKRFSNYTFFHQSNKQFGFHYIYFFIRSDWLLSDRVNEIFMWIWEAGLHEFWETIRETSIHHKKKISEAKFNVDFLPISLEQLIFAFIILGVGLTCATIAFIIELYVTHRKRRILYVKPTQINGTKYNTKKKMIPNFFLVHKISKTKLHELQPSDPLNK